MKNRRYWDAQAFLAPQMKLPEISPKLNLAGGIVTAAPPFFNITEDILNGKEMAPGKYIPGVHQFRECLFKQGLQIGLSKNSIEIAEQSDGSCLVLGLQHPPLDATVANLELLYGEGGVRVMTLAYEGENIFGGGFAFPQSPLTEKGKELLRNMAQIGFILDLSHAGLQTIHDSIWLIDEENLNLPIMVSHTGSSTLFNSQRNVTDNLLNSIALLGGFIGVYDLTFGLSETEDTPKSFLEHIWHLVLICGIKNVGIGSDGQYAESTEEERRGLFEMMNRMVKLDSAKESNFIPRYPTEAEKLDGPNKMETIYRLLMKSRPEYLSGEDVDRITGRNLYSFLKKNLR